MMNKIDKVLNLVLSHIGAVTLGCFFCLWVEYGMNWEIRLGIFLSGVLIGFSGINRLRVSKEQNEE